MLLKNLSMPEPSYTLINPQTKELALRITHFEDNEPFRLLRSYHYFSMLLLSSGAGTVLRDRSSYAFESPCLLSFSIYQPFKLGPENGVEGWLINFHPSFFCLFRHRNEVSCNGVLFNNLYDSPALRLSVGEWQRLSLVADQVCGEFSATERPDEEVLLSYLKIFLINASRIKIELGSGTDVAIARTPPTAERLRHAIELHFKKLHTPADYGDLLNLSVKTLNNASKAFFHKTVTDLIAERMMIEAKRELYLTSKPVKEIAFELGYADEFYFSRYFKKKVGVSPQLFRDKVGFDQA